MIHKPPYSPCRLNRGHPHADGLTAAYLFNERTGDKAFDYALNNNNITLTDTDWVSDGINANANGEIGSAPITNLFNMECGTIVLYFKSDVAIGFAKDRTFIGQNAVGGCLMRYFQGAGIRLYLRDTTSHYINTDNNDYPNFQSGTQISWVWDRQNEIYGGYNLGINVDGLFLTPIGAVRSNSWDVVSNSGNLGILNDSVATTFFAYGTGYYLYFFNKPLKETVLSSIYQNPYAMFQFEEDDF